MSGHRLQKLGVKAQLPQSFRLGVFHSAMEGQLTNRQPGLVGGLFGQQQRTGTGTGLFGTNPGGGSLLI